jgi:hypothetical protein
VLVINDTAMPKKGERSVVSLRNMRRLYGELSNVDITDACAW